MPIYNHLESISCRMTQLFVLQAHHYSYTPTIAAVNKGMTGMMSYSHNDIPTSFKLCMNKNHNTKLIVFTERSKCNQQAKGQKSPRWLSTYNRIRQLQNRIKIIECIYTVQCPTILSSSTSSCTSQLSINIQLFKEKI